MQGSGKERYVFLSFPHISVDAMGTIGAISRPGRPGQSCACGALNAALADIKATGLKANCKRPGGEGPLHNLPLCLSPCCDMSDLLRAQVASALGYDVMLMWACRYVSGNPHPEGIGHTRVPICCQGLGPVVLLCLSPHSYAQAGWPAWSSGFIRACHVRCLPITDWLKCKGIDMTQLCAEHEALDPEYSILKQRLARRMRHDGLTDADLPNMDLVAITKVGWLSMYIFWDQCLFWRRR